MHEITETTYSDFVDKFGSLHDSAIIAIYFELTGNGLGDSVLIDIRTSLPQLMRDQQPIIRLTLGGVFEFHLMKSSTDEVCVIYKKYIDFKGDHIVVDFDILRRFHPEKTIQDIKSIRRFKCHRLWWEYL